MRMASASFRRFCEGRDLVAGPRAAALSHIHQTRRDPNITLPVCRSSSSSSSSNRLERLRLTRLAGRCNFRQPRSWFMNTVPSSKDRSLTPADRE